MLQAYFQRLVALSAKKKHDKAFAEYNEGIPINPKNASAHDNRGNALSSRKEYDKAIAEYDEAIRLDPKYGLAYNDRPG